MSPDEPSEIRIGRVEVPEHLRPHYANYVNVNHTPWDFRLMFALIRTPIAADEVTAVAEDSTVHPQAVAEMIIPANLVHAVIMALQDNFEKYLQSYGVPGMNPQGPQPNTDGES